MFHRSGFAIPPRPLRLCGYLDSLDGRVNRGGAEEDGIWASALGNVERGTSNLERRRGEEEGFAPTLALVPDF
jgi:hypothetical protein